MYAKVLLETPITFEVNGGIVHSPMVRATVNGTSTKLILDTGSTDHVLTIQLAGDANLTSTPAEPGTDHAGAPVPSWALGDVTIAIDDVALQLHGVVAIDSPAPFAGWNVGGFVSPQNLHPTAFVVMDLLENKLFLVDGDEIGLTEWLTSHFPNLLFLTLPRVSGETVFIHASVEPFDDVAVMLNTGSPETEVARSAVPGLRGAHPKDPGFGVSGAVVEGEVVTGQTLRAGDTRFAIPSLFIREQMPPEHGLGMVCMDVLRGTVLVVTKKADRIYWLVPSSS